MLPLRLGGLTLKTGVVQSPMAGCTDLAFRLIAREKGMEFAFLEMVSAHALVRSGRKTLEMMKTVPEDSPLGAQLVGGDPAIMAEAAARIEDMGFALLDLNLGCPMPKITGGAGGAGAALLTQPDKAERIFKAVVGAVRRIPVTVKMRVGYRDRSGAEAVEIARRAAGAGIAAVAVHGRTREQRYRGAADYEAIARVKRAVSIPVLGNGDVFSGADARRLLRVSGCDGIMIGRGALGNPWLYREAAAALEPGKRTFDVPSFEDRRRTLLRHLRLELRFAEERTAVLNMRKVACWYFSGVPGAAAFRRALTQACTAGSMRRLIAGFRGGPRSARTATSS